MSTNDLLFPDEHDTLPDIVRALEAHTNGVDDGETIASPEKQEDAEEALESHEVIELQAFIERKEWIEEKIRLLESLPPIDIFLGMDDLPKAQEIPGLPTRAQLNDWVVEQDKIEKETEIFDSGDLKKLKQLTKAATRRTLSPQDTDLIEITLTTLVALDKLLHLLRDRSEQLDLLNVRLEWEEHRLNAYKSQREVLSDLRKFLSERARWSQDIYNSSSEGASSSTITSPKNVLVMENSDALSRTTRFKIAEDLSRDAAHFSSRVTALRHGHVAASGKLLDKLIDNSRKPVPELMLDEQDRVEEKCGTDLETVGKFAMLVVMQWKKADETYVETKKDEAAAQSLIDELSHAVEIPPSSRLEHNFSGRVDALSKRLLLRSDPAMSISTFPLPIHSLFPEQTAYNARVVDILSSELKSARRLVKEASKLAKEYRARCEAVMEADRIRGDISGLRASLALLKDKLMNGFAADDGDGAPPDLKHVSCVEPMRFSAYLAMFPTTLEQLGLTLQNVSETSNRARSSVLRLGKIPADEFIRQALMLETDNLEEDAQAVIGIKDGISQMISSLREVRRIWSALDVISKSAEGISAELKESLIQSRWKQEVGTDAGPLTPESGQAILPATVIEPRNVDAQLEELKGQLQESVITPALLIRDNLPVTLYDSVENRWKRTQDHIRELGMMNTLLLAVQKQSTSMENVRDDAHALESRIEELKVSYDQCLQDTISFSDLAIASSLPFFTDEDIAAREESLGTLVQSTQREVNLFIGTLPSRVPFISRRSSDPAKVVDVESGNVEASSPLPFDPVVIDRIVRNDSNAYSLRLSSSMKSLLFRQSLSAFYKSARSVSKRLVDLAQQILVIDGRLNECSKSSLSLRTADVENRPTDYLAQITSLKSALDAISAEDVPRVPHVILEIRKMLDNMRNMPGIQDDVTHLGIFTSRSSKLDELDLHWHRLLARLESVKGETADAERAELARLQKEVDSLKAIRQDERRKAEQEKAEFQRKADEEAATAERVAANAAGNEPKENGPNDDIFAANYRTVSSMDADEKALLEQVRRLRKRLNSLHLENLASPSEGSRRASSTAMLPSPGNADTVVEEFESIKHETADLPRSVGHIALDNELHLLREAVVLSQAPSNRVKLLGRLSQHIGLCDIAFSEFLDHIDSYPALPNVEGAPGVTNLNLSSEEMLQERMAYTKGIFGDMNEHFRPVADDFRAIGEYNRLKQTWDELMEMGLEKLNGRPSRPTSVSAYSSGRNSSASASSSHITDSKRSVFAKLSVGLDKGGFLVPSSQRASSTQRRIISSSASTKAQQDAQSRSSLNISRTHATRSVSGPMSPPSTSSSSLYSSTFASRQRTTSLSSTTSSVMSGGKARVIPSSVGRRMSSTQADAARMRSPSITSTRGTWARAPRQSFSSVPRAATPDRSIVKRKQNYVANPKNKLDVAVGAVVNNLPVDINVEVVADTWKDKSGKYWIGGSEPKLCFCRILRSQTVMVRVGGGWSELSKFIKDHFADLFRLIPESPPRPGTKEEKWINASTLREAAEQPAILTPQTPESASGQLPSFALSTPDGSLAKAFPSTPSLGAPLTPLQFMRRAEPEPSELSLSSLALSAAVSTPSKLHQSRSKGSISSTPSKQVVWRP